MMSNNKVMVSTKPQGNKITLPELKRELEARRLIAKKLGANSISILLFLTVEMIKRRLKAKV